VYRLNKRTILLISETCTQETSVSLPLVKLYKNVLSFALGPTVSEILKTDFFSSAFNLKNIFPYKYALLNDINLIYLVMHAPSSSIVLLILNQAVEDSAWALVPKL
jgi:hypothetical protein